MAQHKLYWSRFYFIRREPSWLLPRPEAFRCYVRRLCGRSRKTLELNPPPKKESNNTLGWPLFISLWFWAINSLPTFPAEQFGSLYSLERLYSRTHQTELGENSLALMKLEGFQRANGNSSRSSNFHSVAKAVLQKFPKCLGLFYPANQSALGFLC